MNKRLLLTSAAVAFAAGAWWSWREATPSAELSSDQTTLGQLLSHSWQDADGQKIELEPLSGRILVLNFWATWCAPCVEEMPELSALSLELAASKIQWLGIGIDSPNNIRQFAEKHRISYPLPVVGAAGLDWIKGLGNASGGLPFTVVIDRRGTVSSRILGRVDIKKLREQLLSLTRS